MKRVASIIIGLFLITAVTGCASGIDRNEITVVSREDGSGTRGAFTELFEIEEKEKDYRVDRTTEEAIIVNSTSVLMTSVAGDKNSIGYISLGSLNDTVKAIKIDDTDATSENIKNETYKISRPFNIAIKDDMKELAQDYIHFILSSDGQKIVEDNGYIAASEEGPYSGTKPSGKIVVSGSSSVTPVMEKLMEAYQEINPNADIEIQLSDSTTGMQSVIEGTCDIGMASRELKNSEIDRGLKPIVIALDGLAIIVNNKNQIENLTMDQVKGIFTGEITSWIEISRE